MKEAQEAEAEVLAEMQAAGGGLGGPGMSNEEWFELLKNSPLFAKLEVIEQKVGAGGEAVFARMLILYFEDQYVIVFSSLLCQVGDLMDGSGPEGETLVNAVREAASQLKTVGPMPTQNIAQQAGMCDISYSSSILGTIPITPSPQSLRRSTWTRVNTSSAWAVR